MNEPWLIRIAPVLFVLLWSTGWLVAKVAMPYAEPLTLLVVRYAMAASILAAACVAMGVTWPRSRSAIGHAMASGVLLHALYFAGVWWAVWHGLPVAISGLITALQPLLTALLAPWLLGEKITRGQWAGVILGSLGIALVLAPALSAIPAGKLSEVLLPLAVNITGMIGATLGTFYQKRFITQSDVRAVTVLQNIGAIIVTLPFAYATETMQVTWSWPLIVALVWVVLANSIAAIALLATMIRHGAVSRAASLIFLMPPMVAAQAVLMFGETLSPVQMIGMAVTAAGVALAVRKS
jgi:drug/metabolite transporter (DMT)-like permease